MRDDQTRLEDILRAISHIERYATRSRSGFDRDELSLALRESHPEVPWSGIIGMRNVLVHGYFSIELEEVWGTVERYVPGLREQIEAILRKLGPSGPPTVSELLRPYLTEIRWMSKPIPNREASTLLRSTMPSSSGRAGV